MTQHWLSFAQFEREVTAERIRDKIAASKKKGLWMGGNVPLGYQPDGRTLTIDDAEALTVRTLYDLYLKHGVLRDVKGRAEELHLRARRRNRGDGRVTGGGPFDRGHIYHILANPIYAGRIRHKGQFFEGKHPAIIDPVIWEQVQVMLADSSLKSLGTKRSANTSPLVGKIFDETGDRLTPSHSQKNSKRLRYYISGRPVTERKGKHPDAWRLPAEQLEGLLIEVVQQHLGRSGAAALMTNSLSAAEIVGVTAALSKTFKQQQIFEFINRVDLKPGSLHLKLDVKALANALGLSELNINPDACILKTLFQMRRRGVEIKLHLGETPNEIDRTLIQNIAKAKKWLGMIIEGQTFMEIADAEGTSKRRIQAVVELALLSPQALDAIVAGEQPVRMTSDYLIKTGFSAIWSEQSKQFAQL